MLKRLIFLIPILLLSTSLATAALGQTEVDAPVAAEDVTAADEASAQADPSVDEPASLVEPPVAEEPPLPEEPTADVDDESYKPFWVNLAVMAEISMTRNQPTTFRFGVGAQFADRNRMLTFTPTFYGISGIEGLVDSVGFRQGSGADIFADEYRVYGNRSDVAGIGAAAAFEFSLFHFTRGRLSVYFAGGVDYYIPQYEFTGHDPSLTWRLEGGPALYIYADDGADVALSAAFLYNGVVFAGTTEYKEPGMGATINLKVVLDINELLKQSRERKARNGEVAK